MNFQEKLQIHIESLEKLSGFKEDMALRQVVEQLKQVRTQNDLKRYESSIRRISIDSIQNWETINIISEFLTINAK